MLKKTLIIVNPPGFHLRPASVLSQTAMKFKCGVIIGYEEKRIVTKNILSVMAAGIESGTEITPTCDGEDKTETMETVSGVVEPGLDEM